MNSLGGDWGQIRWDSAMTKLANLTMAIWQALCERGLYCSSREAMNLEMSSELVDIRPLSVEGRGLKTEFFGQVRDEFHCHAAKIIHHGGVAGGGVRAIDDGDAIDGDLA